MLVCLALGRGASRPVATEEATGIDSRARPKGGRSVAVLRVFMGRTFGPKQPEIMLDQHTMPHLLRKNVYMSV